MVAVAVILIVVGVLLLLGVWLTFGPGPRRRRAFRQGQTLLKEEKWQEALELFQRLEAEGGLSEVWQGRLHKATGECYQVAAEQSLRAKNYEEGLDWALKAAPLMGVEESQQRGWVVENMLAEVRRLFSLASNDVEVDSVTHLLTRLFQIQAQCPEASFWTGLCLLKKRQHEPAMKHLQVAHTQAGKHFLDPAFYMGMVQHRLENYQEAIRLLSEANRADSTCPFVTTHLGITMVAAGGDCGMALRTLQRAMGPKGLQLWASTPERAWMEAFPETRSYVRRLAQKHQYTCPLLGKGLATILRMGTEAQAQAHYRLCQFQESAGLYNKLLQDSAPTASVLRGLGLSLCRLQRYDQAYKHLRTALEMEQGKDPLTAGYLALCGAMGKPVKQGDKAKNVAWAIKLLGRYQLPGNAEWANIYNEIFAEARTAKLKLAKDDQVALCNVVASVHGHDKQAAEAYQHLAATFPNAVLPRHAWLYCRAAAQHKYSSDQDMDLFALTFKDSSAAKHYFERLKWNFDEVEYTYLERAANRQPGQFPTPLGASYASRGEAFLLERSTTDEAAGEGEKAKKSIEILLRLAPNSVKGLDRLACLHYRSGDLDQSVELLNKWRQLEPKNYWPVIRQAILEQERGNARGREQAIQQALGLTQGTQRADVAYLGAQLALRETAPKWKDQSDPAQMQEVQGAPLQLLDACLREDPEHAEGVCCLAAVRSRLGDVQGMIDLSPAFSKAEVTNSRYHLLGAVCAIAANDPSAGLERAQRAIKTAQASANDTDKALLPEGYYVMAVACLHLKQLDAAIKAFTYAAHGENPSSELARAFLGRVHYERGNYDEAIAAWTKIDAQQRTARQLDEPLRQLVLLAGLDAYENDKFEQAADRFREAGQLGLRDPRLGSMITLSLVRAGQRLLFEE